MTPTIPSSYTILVTTVTCVYCKAKETHSEFMAVYWINPRHHAGNAVRQMRHVDRVEYNIPIDHQKATPRTTPFCAQCHNISLAHLPPPPSEAALHDLPEPALKTAAKAKPTTPPRRKPTIEELA